MTDDCGRISASSMPDSLIVSVTAREILDSRGDPTVAVEMTLAGGARATAMVPSDASTGAHEAVELREGEKKRYRGKSVLKAVAKVKDSIAHAVIVRDPTNKRALSTLLIELDGS